MPLIALLWPLLGAHDVEVFWSGGRTYAIVTGAYEKGVQILYITDPYAPTPVSAIFDDRDGFSALDGVHDVEVFWSGGRTYAIVTAAHDDGVQIIDITDLTGIPAPQIGVGIPLEQRAYEETGETVSAILVVQPGQSTILQDINNLEFSCSGAVAVRSVIIDGLASGFGSFTELKMGAGSDTTNHQDLMLEDVGGDTYTATLEDPLELDGGIFTLSGTIVSADPALITISYDAVNDATCEAVPGDG